MRVEIFKDGAMQGWFVNTLFTFLTMVMLVMGFFHDHIRLGWEKYGGIYATIYLGGMAAWFTYKVAKTKVEGGVGSNSETVADALKKVTEAMASFHTGEKTGEKK